LSKHRLDYKVVGKKGKSLLLNPVHTSNNVEATLSNSTKSNVASTLCLVWTGLYTLPSVGPGADPGVQAVSPQVT